VALLVLAHSLPACSRGSVRLVKFTPEGGRYTALVNGILRLVNDDDVRAYAQRAWHVLTELERDHWARELSEHGPLATLEASQALWAHMRRVRPDWPTETDRSADLAHHVVLKQAIDRAARAFTAAARR